MAQSTVFSLIVISLVLVINLEPQQQAVNGQVDISEDPKPTTENTTTTSETDDNNNNNGTSQVSCGLPFYRLPQKVKPHHYDLLIMPDIESESFEGAVQISLSVGNSINKTTANTNRIEVDENSLPPNQIVLHASEHLNIDKVWYLNQVDESHLSPAAGPKLNKVDATLNQLLMETKPPKQIAGSGSTGYEYVEVVKTCHEPKHQLLVLTLGQNLAPNSRGLLHFTFSGFISKRPDLNGLYLSGWFATAAAGRNESGSNILTQFQPTHARKMFPCFDEPALKATFDLSLIYRANKTALANTSPIYEQSLRLPTNLTAAGLNVAPNKGPPTANETTTDNGHDEEEDYKLVRYARTPPMSTYLLAFTVGDYEFIESFVQLRTKRLRVRIYTAPSKTARAQFALQTVVKTMKLLHRLFDDEYPLDKIDLIGVRDFNEGAMENWGLITFREENLLFDEQNSAPQMRAQIASIIIHELAHQWFGNFVTMSWWNDIWLNEGFTTWMEYKILAEVYPEFDHLNLFESHIKALESDQMLDARPIRQRLPADSLQSSNHIEALFDYVGYHKSASVIRMLESCWKWTNFWQLIRNYIKLNKFKSVAFEDLIESLRLDKNLPKPMIETATSWIEQAGYPVIDLRLDNNNNRTRLHYEQKRFVKHTASNDSEDTSRQVVWPIPVKATLFDGKKAHTEFYLLNQTKGSIDLPQWWLTPKPVSPTTTAASRNSTNNNKWIKFNKDFDGFYVVRYSDDMFRSLRGSSMELVRSLSSQDRINLIEETLILFGAKRVGADRLLQLMMDLGRHEKHGAVLRSLVKAFASLASIFNRHDSPANRAIGQFGQKLFGDLIFRQFPKEIVQINQQSNSSYWDTIGRAQVFERLVQLDYKPAVARALQLFEESRRRTSGGRPVAVHLREPVYLGVARRGTHEQFMGLASMYEASDSLEHRLLLLNSMCRSDNRTRLMGAWELLMNSTMDDRMLEQLDEIKLEPLISMTKDNRVGRQFVLDLLAHNLTDIIDLNEDESVVPLLEELYLNAGPDELARMSEVVMRLQGDPVADWQSSLEYIMPMLEWRSDVRDHSAGSIESTWLALSGAN